MTEQLLNAGDLPELQPIRPGFFESWRLLRKLNDDPLGHAQLMQERYGNAVMQKVAGIRLVHLYGAEAHRLALVNNDDVFSNKKAWDRIIGRIFPNGLMLRDGDDHRYHRRLMQAGFKVRAMQRYMQEMAPQVETAVTGWPVSRARPCRYTRSSRR